MFVRALLAQMGLPQGEPTPIGVDNSGAVELSRDKKSCHRSRHVDRRFFKVRELEALGEIRVYHVPTEHNSADVLTKALPREDFERHRATLMQLPGAALGSSTIPVVDTVPDPAEAFGEDPADLRSMTHMVARARRAHGGGSFLTEGGVGAIACVTRESGEIAPSGAPASRGQTERDSHGREAEAHLGRDLGDRAELRVGHAVLRRVPSATRGDCDGMRAVRRGP